MIKYLIPFLTSFLLTVLLTALLIYPAKKIRWIARTSARHIHKPGIYRIGGVAMVLSFIIAIFINSDLVISPELYGLLLGVAVFLVVGFWDDFKEIHWKAQLASQIAVAVLIFIMGVRIYSITNPLTGGTFPLSSGFWVVLATIIVIVWIVLVINAINWVDGLDGLSGGITAISSMTILMLSLRPEVNQPPIAIICAVILGTAIGFLVFNFYPSRVLAGTVGSSYMGLVLAVLAVFSGTKIATALLVLSIPIIDSIWVIGERLREGKSIFKPDKNHLHYRLLELGWSQKKVVAVYYLFTIAIAFIALNTRAIGKSVTLISVFIFMLAVSLIVNKKLPKEKKLSQT